MQWIKNNKKYVLIGVVLGLVGIFGLIHATKMRIERAAKLSCVVQYDEMMGGVEVNEEISEMLRQKKRCLLQLLDRGGYERLDRLCPDAQC